MSAATDDRVPPYDDLARRVTALEADMRQVKDILVGLDTFVRATLPHLATKAELADLPTKTDLWTVLGGLVAAIFGAVALGSVVVGH